VTDAGGWLERLTLNEREAAIGPTSSPRSAGGSLPATGRARLSEPGSRGADPVRRRGAAHPLAAQLGSNLRGVCYVLDEPSIGLHQRDNAMLIDTLVALRDKGNSVIVVEHDEDTMRQADEIIDLGPGAGCQGGRIVARGSAAELAADPASVTGRFLARPASRRSDKARPCPPAPPSGC
jgi:excinuclease ABC subunit A